MLIRTRLTDPTALLPPPLLRNHTSGRRQISQMGKWTFVPRDFVHRNPRMKRLTDSGVGTYFPGSKGKK
eukprot:jgi/Tetstr1/460190/TSEL_005505.t1